jgi:hypothetical protein
MPTGRIAADLGKLKFKKQGGCKDSYASGAFVIRQDHRHSTGQLSSPFLRTDCKKMKLRIAGACLDPSTPCRFIVRRRGPYSMEVILSCSEANQGGAWLHRSGASSFRSCSFIRNKPGTGRSFLCAGGSGAFSGTRKKCPPVSPQEQWRYSFLLVWLRVPCRSGSVAGTRAGKHRQAVL